MSRLRRRLSIVLSLFLILSLFPSTAFAQTGDGPVFLPAVFNSKTPIPTIVNPDILVLSPETTQHLAAVSKDQSTFTFNQTPPQLNTVRTGTIVVSGPAPNAPAGFLRRVTQISTAGGKTTLQTKPATLEEAITQGSFSFSQQLSPAAVQKAYGLQGVSLASIAPQACPACFNIALNHVVLYQDPNNQDLKITANGNIALEASFDLSWDIQAGELKRLTFSQTSKETTSLVINGQWEDTPSIVNREILVYTVALSPITFMAGPVPVVVAPVLDVYVGIDGSGSLRVETGIDYTQTLTATASLSDGKPGFAAIEHHQPGFTTPKVSGELALKAYASPQFNFKLYGTAGPWVKLQGYLKANAVREAQPSTAIKFGLRLGFETPIGVDVNVFGKKPANFDGVAFKEEELLQEWSFLPPNPPSDPIPADGAESQSLDTQLSWTGSAMAYDVYFKAGDSNFGPLPAAGNLSSPSYSPGTLAPDTQYFWQVVARSENGLTAKSPVWSFKTEADGSNSITAGGLHTCALTPTGGVKCWGNNSSGQLGDGTTTEYSTTPVEVVGLSGVQAVTAGESHTCALTTTGGVKCWGNNGSGQLGDGGATAYSSPTPVDVIDLSSGVQAITAGTYHTCALTTAGGVKCWGLNNFGQLGDGTTTEYSTTPVDVIDLSSSVQAIAAEYNYTCALTTAGKVKCWGDNWYGQIREDTTTTHYSTPVDVEGLSGGVRAITAGGAHTCALTTTGGVKCWGANWYGQLGNGTGAYSPTPVGVEGLSGGVRAITVGYAHTCALTTAGEMKCWGYNYYGQLGNGTTTNSLTPVDVIGLP